MKKYIQSTAYIICLFAALYALHLAIISYENPFNLYENPLVWIILIGIILMVVMKEIFNIVSLEKTENLELEKKGIDPATVDKYAEFKQFIKRWTKSKPIEEEGEIVLDHNYDGIRELDNSLPPWWLYLFYATIIFGVVYMVRFHILNGDDQETEFLKEIAAAEQKLEEKKSSGDIVVIDVNTVKQLHDDVSLARGKAIFNLNCASCHVQDGGGNTGPNLTDEYWILGGGIKNVFTTISEGGRKGRGMQSWKKNLKSTDIEKVASYVLSLQGTYPKNPKKAEGELWEDEEE
jgi:cytochrome c oxidase cbb3-type subunit 3